MRLGRSSNPALGKKLFEQVHAGPHAEPMTLRGTINKSILMFLLILLTATITWKMFLEGNAMVQTLMWVGIGGGLVMAIVTIFKKEWAPYTAPAYALLEGLFLGSISAYFDAMYPGIAFQAIGLTFAILFMMLFIYRTGVIKVNSKFKRGIVAATGGVFLFYIANFVLGFFGMGVSVENMGLLGIGIQLVIIVIASLNLVLDFDFIEQGSNSGAPKYMEWYAAFGLMVTLVWLYIEILRLLSILAGRD